MIINLIQPLFMRFLISCTFMFLIACGAGQGQSYRIKIDRSNTYIPQTPAKTTFAKTEKFVPLSSGAKNVDGALLPIALHAPTMLRAILSPDPSQSIPDDLQDIYDNIHKLPSEIRNALYKIYTDRAFKLFWIENGRVSKKAMTFRALINREIYLSTPYKEINIHTLQGKRQIDFVRYDLAFMMALIKKLYIIKNGMTQFDGAYGITEGAYAYPLDWYYIFDLAKDNNIAAFKDYMRPNHPFYKALLSEMEHIDKHNLDQPSYKIDIAHTLKPEMAGHNVDILVQKLKMRGYLDPSYPAVLYDNIVQDAVKKFQMAHGAVADGYAGPQTLNMLNYTRSDYIRMLLVNFERIRKAPDLQTITQIRVNVPEYRARYYEHDVETMDMAVIVGRKDRATPIFYDKISYIEFNPYWNVPHRLAVEDILPKVKRTPAYLLEKNFSVYYGNRLVSPHKINWNALNKKNFKYRFRQNPGPKNALGTVKFMFPNKYAVYLHDTPAKSLFHHINRSKSSGCIRVADPVTLASKLLRHKMSRRQVKTIFHAKKNKQVKLSSVVDIALEYFTVSPMGNGKIRYNQDIYKLDAPLFQALQSISYSMSL